MTPWLKDWAPVIAPTLALIGVVVTVHSASRTYRRGQAETRKDRQRTLVAELITVTRRLISSLEIFVPSAGKFQRNDLIEYLGTDSGKRHGELNASVEEATVTALCEISNPRLRPLIIQLAMQWRGLMHGDDAAPLHKDDLPDSERFEAVLVVLKRVWAMKRTCGELEVAAIEVLPVEIEVPTLRSKLNLKRPQRSTQASEPPTPSATT